MSTAQLSAQQLRSLVEERWKGDLDALAVGLHVPRSCQGPDSVDFGNEIGRAEVVSANSVFEIREALTQAEVSQQRLVVLTGLQQGELGNDVVARLARSRLFSIDHWASLSALFKARQLDQTICQPELAQALIDYTPTDGYPPVSAGVLDAGTVWRAICRHVFDMGEREPDLVALLLWAAQDEKCDRYRNTDEKLRANLLQRLTDRLGPAARTIMLFAESGEDAMALAIVCQVLFTESYLEAAAARMEQHHHDEPIPLGIGEIVGRTSVEAIRDLGRQEDSGEIIRRHLQRADELCLSFRCDDHAYRSELTLLGFNQRLARLGQALSRALDDLTKESVKDCEERFTDVEQHRLADRSRYRSQVGRASMAVRLTRWLVAESRPGVSVADFAREYIRDLSFVDWARSQLSREAAIADLTNAFQRLDAEIAKRRESLNEVFAKALADWTSVGSQEIGVIGVEAVLSDVVEPIVAGGNSVLLVVLDGMSWAVCHDLLEDIRQDHWFEATLDKDYQPMPPALAAVPSVTRVSRHSLLTGSVSAGEQSREKRGFKEHSKLRESCTKSHPPILFHKRELTEGNRGVISDEVKRELLSEKRKVVGVVINAIDDRLSKAEQIVDDWSLDSIDPLGGLLRLARDSGRVVVLASDHGHVWHRPTTQPKSSEEGARFRAADGKVDSGEILIKGKRVVADDGNAVIVPWREDVIYGRRQNGYHGGATPQEMLCPIIILTDASSNTKGLNQCPLIQPDWWTSQPAATEVVETPAIRVTPPKTKKKTAQPELFDLVQPKPKPEESDPQVSEGDWINGLLSSDAYQGQKAMVRRHAPEDSQVRTTIDVLNRHGGMMTPTAFAKAADLPVARLDGFVTKLQRLLNVDGYEILILNRQENRLELNVAKLKRQFDLD